MNSNLMRANMQRHAMQMKNALNGENPNHTPHIQEFCDYADAVSLGRAEEVKEQLPSMVQQVLDSNKVKVEVDKKSVRQAKKTIDDLFKHLQRVFR